MQPLVTGLNRPCLQQGHWLDNFISNSRMVMVPMLPPMIQNFAFTCSCVSCSSCRNKLSTASQQLLTDPLLWPDNANGWAQATWPSGIQWITNIVQSLPFVYSRRGKSMGEADTRKFRQWSNILLDKWVWSMRLQRAAAVSSWQFPAACVTTMFQQDLKYKLGCDKGSLGSRVCRRGCAYSRSLK
jgi:hypothetical protein